jgi:YkoP domain
MRRIIIRFDHFLSQQNHIFPFDESEACILRLQERNSPHTIALPGRQIQAGESILGFHLWNEHMPVLPPGGPDLAWAVKTHRLFVASLRSMARYIQVHPNLSRAAAIFGVTSLFDSETSASGVHPMQRLGFTIVPYHSPLGGFGSFWENFYARALVWAYNPVGARTRHVAWTQRTEMWMLISDLLARYGRQDSAAP